MEKIFLLKWFGAILVAAGALLLISWDSLCNLYLAKRLSLSPGSAVYSYWSKSIDPIELDVYLFNWTNPEELYEENYKPNLVEVGPYRFSEYQEKVNVTWNDNFTVSFRQLRTWVFDPEHSVGSMEENITMLNIVPVAASYQARNWGLFSSWSLSTSLKMLEKHLWITRPVREFLFDGYHDPLLTLSSVFSDSSRDKMGFFYGKNNTYMKDGYYNMDTGADDRAKIGQLRSWDYGNRTHNYPEGCDTAKGFLGHFFPPNMPTEEPVYFFTPDLSTSVELNFKDQIEIRGVTANRFVPSRKLLDNGHEFPDTRCNCYEECLPYGVLNISRTAQGSPLFVSYPHFLDADPSYLVNITGLSPSPNRSHFEIDVQPELGLPVKMMAHLQYNILLEPNPKLSMFENVPRVMFPLMWLQKKVSLSQDSASVIKLVLNLPTLGMSCAIGLVLLGVIMVSLAVLPRLFRAQGGQDNVKIRKQSLADAMFNKAQTISFKKDEKGSKEKALLNQESVYVNEKNEEADKAVRLLKVQETDILT